MPNQQPRRGHCVAAFNLSMELTEVVIFGGNTAMKDYRHIAATSVLQFGKIVYHSIIIVMTICS